MKDRMMATASALLLAALPACGPDEIDAPETTTPEVASGRKSLSPARKEIIRRFWKLQVKATESRVRGEWAQAATLYQQALELDSDHEDALYYLGNMLFEEGDYTGAVDAWRRLLVANPSATRGHLQLATLYSSGQPGAPFDLEMAEREVDAAMGINREESGPLLKLGEVSLLRGDFQKAAGLIESARRANYRSVAGHYLAGYIHWVEGDTGRAVAALRQAVAAVASGKTASTSASNEGDTKKGTAMLATGTRPRSLFEPYWQSVRDWEGEVSAAMLDREYGPLRARLENL